MRVSCDPDDHGYQAWLDLGETRYTVKVFLDSVEIKDVVTADEEAGMIVRHMREGSGHFKVDGAYFYRETLYGVVELH